MLTYVTLYRWTEQGSRTSRTQPSVQPQHKRPQSEWEVV